MTGTPTRADAAARVRVAFTSLAPFISGAERSLQVTVRHLPAHGVDPLVFGPPGAALADWCREAHVPFVAVPLAFRDKRHPFKWWRSVRAVREALIAHHADVVHANQMWSFPAAGAAARRLGLPRVCHLRDEVDGPTLRWCCQPGVEAAIGISRHIAAQARAAWADDPSAPMIETIVNPVDLPPTPTAAEDARLRLDARRALGLPGDAYLAGFIGQLREVKGLFELIDSLASIPDPMCQLVIAGKDPLDGAPYLRRCEARAHAADLRGRVHFLGFLDRTEPFYRAIDVAVVPSHEEPLGRVPLEAAAHRRPSIAFAVGGLPEVVAHGRTGWLVEAGNVAAFASRIRESAGRRSSEMADEARRWVEQLSDPHRYAERLSALYRQLLAPEVQTAAAGVVREARRASKGC